MGLIDHDNTISGEQRIHEGLAEEHAVRHVLDTGLDGGANILKADCVADLGGRRWAN